MRGRESRQTALFSYVSLDERVPSDHPLRRLRVLENGILARDFPLVQGAILIVASSYVFVNLAVDVAYAYLDPRIRYD